MQSKAATVAQYLAELPVERQTTMLAVAEVIRKNLDPDVQEGIQYGMIGYFVPHRIYPAGYHCNPKEPLPFAGLASQKNYMSLYMMGLYLDAGDGQGGELSRWFQEAWAKTGKKLDMGKSCIRFKRLDDLPLDVVGETIRRMTAKGYIAQYEATLRRTKSR